MNHNYIIYGNCKGFKLVSCRAITLDQSLSKEAIIFLGRDLVEAMEIE
jgi:hypothetical protein